MSITTDAIDLLRELIHNACVNDLTSDSRAEYRNAEALERFFANAHQRRSSVLNRTPAVSR